MFRQMFSWVLPCLVVALVAGGCTSLRDEATSGAGWAADQAIADVTERLAVAGIGVYADATSTAPLVDPADPVSPVRLLQWQVRSLALEAARHGGVAAAELDAASPGETVESVDISASGLIAGWATYAETPAADYARELLGESVETPEQAAFPQLVLLLFASDLAVAGASLPDPAGKAGESSESTPDGESSGSEDSGASSDSMPTPGTDEATPSPSESSGSAGTATPSPSSDGGAGSAAPDSGSSDVDGVHGRVRADGGSVLAAPAFGTAPCSAVLGFVNNVIGSVFDAIGRLQNPPPVSGGGIFGKIINVIGKVVVGGVNLVLDGLNFVLTNGVRIAIAPVMAIVAKIAGIVGTVAQVTSAVRPWTVVMTGEPEQNRKAIGNEAPLAGQVTARVDLGGLDEWPGFMADCAQHAGVALPPLKPEGNPVTWTVVPSAADLVVQGETDKTLSDGSAATLNYQTTVEPEYKKATEAVGVMSATAAIQRDDVRKLQEAFSRLVQEGLADLLPPIGEIVSPLIYPRIEPIIAKAFSALEHLRDATGSLNVPISYHIPDDEEPGDSGTGPSAGAVGLPGNCPGADVIAAATGIGFQEPTSASSETGDRPLSCLYGFEGYGEGMHSTAILDVTYSARPPGQLEELVAQMTEIFEANGGGAAMPPCEPLTLPDAQVACMQTVVDVELGGRVALYVDTGTFLFYVHLTTIEYAVGDDLPFARDIAIPVAGAVMEAA